MNELRQMPKSVRVLGVIALVIFAGYLIYRLGHAVGFWLGSN